MLLLRFIVPLFSLIGIGSAVHADGAKDVYNINFKTIDGKPLPLSQYRGQVILVVNTASKCGFTPQYDGLETLYKTYKDRGLVILGVPSNDFGGQEPGTEKEIKTFCETNFNITFPLASKELVTGSNAHPFYRQARAHVGVFGKPTLELLQISHRSRRAYSKLVFIKDCAFI